MDSKPPGGRPADAAELARDLVDRLSAIATSLAHGPGAQAGGSGAAASGSGAPALLADFRSPRAVLENGAGYVSPYLPPEASLRPLKALLLRVLRIVTRDQTTFNSALLEAVRGTLLAADGAFRETSAAIERSRTQAAESGREAERRILDALEKSHASLEEAVRAAREESARSVEAGRRSLEEVASRLELADEAQRGAQKEAAGRSEELRAELRSSLERLRKVETGTAASLAHFRSRSDGIAADVLATQVRMDLLEQSREALAAEGLATQVRIDGLERDRDRLSDGSAAGERAVEELKGSLAALEARIEERSEDLRHLKLEWSTLRSEIVTLSGRPARKGADEAQPAGIPAADDPMRAGLYVDFEEGFRGSEAEIRKRQEADVALFRSAPGPVADLGCGRGEFLDALTAAGIPAIGCDSNAIMAARAREKGLKVERADLFEWLSAQGNGSLGGITAYQVVEHLPPARLYELVELSAAKLGPGGIVLFETVNPESAYAMKWFWMDLTHVRPVPAPSLARLLTASGFRDVRVDWRSPVPDSEAPPAELRTDEKLGPMMKLLFGPQDYAVTGRK